MTNLLDDFAVKNGFLSGMEMAELIASIDLTTDKNQDLFFKWKTDDGTKEGLLKVKEKTNAK